MLLLRNRYNGRILAFPVDLTKRGASLMKIRLSVIAFLVGLALSLACCSPAQARNILDMNIALEGDPGGGFVGLPGEHGSSGGAASSSFGIPTYEVDLSHLWLRAICSHSPLLRILVVGQSNQWVAPSKPTFDNSTNDSGRPE
jgi:hypothetical protein